MEDINIWVPPMEINCSENNGVKVLWNVDLLRKDTRRTQKKLFSVQMLFNPDNIVDATYAMTKSMDEPIIIMKTEEDSYEILDGKHRLYKAKMTGQKEIWAYVISMEDRNKYILPTD